MAYLTIRNKTKATLPINAELGVLPPSGIRSISIRADVLEQSEPILQALTASGLIQWTVTDSPNQDPKGEISTVAQVTAQVDTQISKVNGLQRLFSDFDPGASVPHRWNVAFSSAMALQATESFQLVIDGTYQFDQAINITVPMTITGQFGLSAMQFPITGAGRAGITIFPTAAGTSMSGLVLIGPDPFGGADDGITVHGARCVFSFMTVLNWGHIGFNIHADINSGTNANECTFTKIQFVLCGNSLTTQDGTNAGVYLAGGDSNGCTFISCDANDCRRGFFDSSFLGNIWIGCSVEGCNDRFTKNPMDPVLGYGFLCSGLNARSTYIGCYMESDSDGSINSPAIIIGGFPSNTRGNALLLTHHAAVSYLAAGGSAYTDPNDPGPGPGRLCNFQIGSDQAGVLAQLNVQNLVGIPLQLPHTIQFGMRVGLGDWYQLKWGGLDDGDVMRWRNNQVWFPNDIQRGGSRLREVVAPSIGAAGPSDGGTWQVGDRLIISAPGSGQPSTYRCTAVVGSSPGVPTWKVESTLA